MIGMKRPSYAYILELLLFLAFVAVSYFLLSPVSRRLDAGIANVRDGLLSRIETMTGLEFSYSSLSPSVLRSVKIRDLVVTDAANGAVVARVSEVSVVYGFRQLLAGDLAGAIREIVIRDGEISIDTKANAVALENIRRLIDSGGTLTPRQADSPQRRDSSQGSDREIRVRVDDVSLSVRDAKSSAEFSLSSAHASLTDDGVLFGLDGSVSLRHPLFSLSAATSADISVNGSIDRAFDAGSVLLTMSSLESGKYSLSRLGLMVSFRDGVVTCNSVGSLEPVDIRAEWDIAQGRFRASARCDGLLPLRWVHVRGDDSSVVRSLENASLTGSATLTVEDGKGPEYSIDMKALLPSALYGGGTAGVRCSGDASRLRFDDLSFQGPAFDVYGRFTYDFATKMPEGYVSAKKIMLRNGCVLSTEAYVQPEGSRFICLFPEIRVNGAVFSSVECAVEPGPETLDFSVSAYDESGHIGMEGTFSTGNGKFLELYSSFDSISVLNAARAYAAIVNPDADYSSVYDKLSSFALTTEAYLSTDFSEFSFNCTRLVLASNERNGLYLLLSAKGNADGVDVTDIRFSSNGYDFTGNAYAVLGLDGSIAFNADATVNDVPYAFSGTWGDGNLVVNGEYGFSLTALFGNGGTVSGLASANGLPVSAPPALLSVSFDASFRYSSVTDWEILWNRASAEDVGNSLPLSTVFSFTGTTGPRGAVLETIALSDRVSTLTGNASMVARGDGSFDAALALSSPESDEAIAAGGTVRLTGGLSYSGTVTCRNVPLMRFFVGQSQSSSLTAAFAGSIGSGGLDGKIDVDDLIWKLGEFDLDAKGAVSVSAGRIDATGVSAAWNGHSFSSLAASASLGTLDATLSADYSVIVGKSPLTARIDLAFNPQRAVAASAPTAPAAQAIPAASASFASLRNALADYRVTLSLSDAKWKSYALDEPFTVELDHAQGVSAIVAGKNDAVTGYLLDDGSFTLRSGTSIPVSFNADGRVSGSNLSVRVNDINADLSVLWPLIGITQIAFPAGTVSGSLAIDGLLNDPEFRGKLSASGLVLDAPGLLGESFGPVAFDLIADGKNVTVPETILKGKDGSITVSADIVFDRWFPSTAALHAETLPGDTVRVAVENQFTRAEGYSSFNLDILMDTGFYELDGTLSYERGSFVILFSGFEPGSRTITADMHDWKINLALNIGKKVEFRWPGDEFPIIRGLVQADSPITLNLDTSIGSFDVKGNANLKGGQIFYLKRNFYLRKGNIAFNENQDIFDPLITLRAEIRENDENGKPVRIILLVDNKPLSTFTPVISSDPPKSDIELMALLGQATSADATRETLLKDTVVTASDILTQMSFFRSVENSVRDVLNLDIFSIRTLILQNAILGPGERGTSGTDAKMTIGNYFDNTTVYMGKYLGSAIYTDALAHFTYFDPLTAQNTGESQIVYQNLMIQPEFGFEVSTPLFMLRWSMTPMRPETLFVADSSITLSRKFSY
jgi:translocation and assembly module TamB